MAFEGKLVKSRRKAVFANEQKTTYTPKRLQFAHQMSMGDTDINLTALVQPVSMVGFTSSSAVDLLAGHIYTYKQNLTLARSDGSQLIPYLEYIIVSDSLIRLLSPAQAGTVVYGTIEAPSSGTVSVDGFNIIATGQLGVGLTDVVVGPPFQLFKNPSSQIGAVLVFRNGRLMLRNDGNVTASPSVTTGNYQEFPTGVGSTNLIRFNRPGALLTDGSQETYTIVSNGIVALQPTEGILAILDSLGGQMDQVIAVLAAVSGNPTSFFQANPNQVDLRVFGDRLIALENKSIFIGSAYIHTGASHTNTAGPTLAPVNAAGGGTPFIEFNPGPGTFSVASVNTPRIGVSGLLPGTYRVTMSVTGNAGTANASLAINDGTTTSGYCGYDGGSNRKNICIGYFTYIAPLTSVVYELWAANDSNTTTIYADGSPGIGASHAWDLHISIEKVSK